MRTGTPHAGCGVKSPHCLEQPPTTSTCMPCDVAVEELEAAIKKLKSGKAPGHTTSIHQSVKATAWLYAIFSLCLHRCNLQKTCHRVTVVALPKPQVVYIHLAALCPVQDSGEVDTQPHRPSGGSTVSSGTSRLPPW